MIPGFFGAWNAHFMPENYPLSSEGNVGSIAVPRQACFLKLQDTAV